MNPLNLELEELQARRPAIPDEDLALPQTVNIVLRLMAAPRGLLTAEIFRNLHCAKYTARISECRQQGHVIEAEHVQGDTVQWRYHYRGYQGTPERLHPALRAPLRDWEHYRTEAA